MASRSEALPPACLTAASIDMITSYAWAAYTDG
ncbi:Uncharacterised protein [Bordetella pertussis]|nr:Uncharacterised protein [Bordetella pertussis]